MNAGPSRIADCIAAGHSVAKMPGNLYRCRSCEKAAARAGIDPVAVERALTGRTPQLMRSADRCVAIRTLTVEAKLGGLEIGRLVAAAETTVRRHQRAMGISRPRNGAVNDESP